jgi:hypothetical protein
MQKKITQMLMQIADNVKMRKSNSSNTKRSEIAVLISVILKIMFLKSLFFKIIKAFVKIS